jgi:hypothetical protein
MTIAIVVKEHEPNYWTATASRPCFGGEWEMQERGLSADEAMGSLIRELWLTDMFDTPVKLDITYPNNEG